MNCLRHDNILGIGGTYHIILNLIQDLKKNPPTLTLPLKGGREKLVGRLYYADRKINSRVSKPDLQVTMAQNDINTFPRPTGEELRERGLSAYDEILRENRTFFTKSEILEKVVKRVQDDRVVSGAHSKELNVLTSYRLNGFKKKAGATHVDMSGNIRCAAFTLAEVLITLAIIGIVAALTIPTLITNYQKKQTASKLKQTYSIISQALTMAQAEHGDTTTWEVAGIYDTPTNDTNFNHEDVITKFTTKYFMPYVKVAKDYGYTQYSKIDYDGDYLPATGLISNSRSAYGYILLLSGNVLIRIGIGTGCLNNERNPDGTCVTQTYKNIVFKVDINGFDKPNVIGKDVFNMTFDLRKKVFGFHNYGISTRQRYLDNCKSDEDAQVCGYLIFLDGWEIKDDYPWF